MFFLAAGVQNLADNLNWTPHSHLSTAASDCSPVGGFGSGSPDFSASGTPITIGYRVFLVLICPAGLSFCAGSVASGLDNFKVTITTVDATSDVPEPSTTVLVSLGLALAAYRLRSRTGPRR